MPGQASRSRHSVLSRGNPLHSQACEGPGARPTKGRQRAEGGQARQGRPHGVGQIPRAGRPLTLMQGTGEGQKALRARSARGARGGSAGAQGHGGAEGRLGPWVPGRVTECQPGRAARDRVHSASEVGRSHRGPKGPVETTRSAVRAPRPPAWDLLPSRTAVTSPSARRPASSREVGTPVRRNRQLSY